MAVVPLVPTAVGWVPAQAGLVLTPAGLTSLSTATQVTFPNSSGNVLLLIFNGSASAINVQPVQVREVEQVVGQPAAYSLGAGVFMAFGPFPINDYNVAGVCTVNVAGAALVTGAALQMTTAPAQI
jgi:hypothetical protein